MVARAARPRGAARGFLAETASGLGSALEEVERALEGLVERLLVDGPDAVNARELDADERVLRGPGDPLAGVLPERGDLRALLLAQWDRLLAAPDGEAVLAEIAGELRVRLADDAREVARLGVEVGRARSVVVGVDAVELVGGARERPRRPGVGVDAELGGRAALPELELLVEVGGDAVVQGPGGRVGEKLVQPPSTVTCAPLMYLLSSSIRNMIVRAMSSASPIMLLPSASSPRLTPPRTL